MVADINSFVKLPFAILKMDMPSEAKILFCVLVDRVSYSCYTDDKGRYYFLSSKARSELYDLISCKQDSFKKYLRILKEKKLITTAQHYNGIRIYIEERWWKKSPTFSKVVEKIPDQVVEKIPDQVGEKITLPIKQNKETKKLKHTDNIIYNNVSNYEKPDFTDVLLYWRQKHYHSSPADYFTYYDLQHWMINNEPVRDWRRLADKWEERQFY